MEKLTSMVDMKRDPKEAEESVAMDQPVYPYGLCLSLGHEELEKLGIGQGELNVNDMLHLHALATVTSVSSHDNIASGQSCRVELQITHISAIESETEEDEEEEKKLSGSQKIAKLYK